MKILSKNMNTKRITIAKESYKRCYNILSTIKMMFDIGFYSTIEDCNTLVLECYFDDLFEVLSVLEEEEIEFTTED